MKKALVVTLFVIVAPSVPARAQQNVQGQWTGLTQCYVNGTWVTVHGNCPSTPSTGSSSSTSAAYSGLSQAGYQLGYAFGRWLFGGGSNPQQQLQERLMMEELGRREAEAERRHQEEEARRITAMYNRLYASLKLSGLPDLHLKGVSDSPGLTLKLGDDAASSPPKRAPGFYTDANGKIQLHGIDGLPGIYADGDGRNTGLSNSTLTLKTGQAAEASSTSPLPPTETGLQLRMGDGTTTPPSPAAPPGQQTPIDLSKMTPQQLADVAEAVSKLPPEEQQRLFAQAQREAVAGQAGNPAAGQPPAPALATSHWEAQPAAPASVSGAPPAQPAALGQPMTPLNPGATGQVQAVAAASQTAAQTPGPEAASAQARVGFDTPTGPPAVPLESTAAKPQILRGPELSPQPLPKSEDEKLVSRMEAQAAKLGWSPEKQAQFHDDLYALDLDSDPHLKKDQAKQTWQSAQARGQDPTLAQEASQGTGLGFPGAGAQTVHQDCTIFALANATGLPYGVVAARAAELIRQGEWHSASDRANPQAVIEQRGLNGGGVIMLAKSFGQAEVVPRQDFAKALNEGRPIMVNVVPANGNVESGHEIVLTKAFQHGGETWFEVMDSNQGPVRRLFLSSKDLNNIVKENGVAFRPEPGTTPQLLRDHE